VDFFPSDVGQKPVDIVNAALKEAKLKFYDVLLVDTAGRLHVDEAMMDEIKQVHAAINPVETLFVVDAMTGQDGFWPTSEGKKPTPTCSASVSSCLIAAGRYTSAETTSTFFLCFSRRHLPSLVRSSSRLFATSWLRRWAKKTRRWI
jgi:hypothetical protein